MAKKKKIVPKEETKELAKVGFKPNEKPLSPQQLEIQRLLKKGREYGKNNKG